MMILTSIAAFSLPLVSLQGAASTAVAIENDNPETWVVEYPRLIQPYVQNYRRCLNVTNRRVTGQADFEIQHRSDIPRCNDVRVESIASSNTELRGARTTMSPEQIDVLFTNIGKIHIARGRDLDEQFNQRLDGAQQAQDAYDGTKPKGLVIELLDAEIVSKQLAESGVAPASQEGSQNVEN